MFIFVLLQLYISLIISPGTSKDTRKAEVNNLSTKTDESHSSTSDDKKTPTGALENPTCVQMSEQANEKLDSELLYEIRQSLKKPGNTILGGCNAGTLYTNMGETYDIVRSMEALILCCIADCISKKSDLRNFFDETLDESSLDLFISEVITDFPILDVPHTTDKTAMEIHNLLQRDPYDKDVGASVIHLFSKINVDKFSDAINCNMEKLCNNDTVSKKIIENLIQHGCRLCRNTAIVSYIYNNWVPYIARIVSTRAEFANSTIICEPSSNESFISIYVASLISFTEFPVSIAPNHMLYAVLCCIYDCVGNGEKIEDYIDANHNASDEVFSEMKEDLAFDVVNEKSKNIILRRHEDILTNRKKIDPKCLYVLISICNTRKLMPKLLANKEKFTTGIARIALDMTIYLINDVKRHIDSVQKNQKK